MLDGYTKTILTVIAGALSVLAYDRMAPGKAAAQIINEQPYPAYPGQCGQTLQRPCYVQIAFQCGSSADPCFVDFKPDYLGLVPKRGFPMEIVR